MEVKEYCVNIRGEIVSWRTKIFDIMQSMDKRFRESDKKSQGSIKVLKDMVDELEKKIDDLEAACPADWSKERADIDQLINDMDKIWEESVEMSPDDF